jgi:hypothetical protein
LSKCKDYCIDCGKELAPDEKPCSNCGSVKRTTHIFAFATVKTHTSLKGKVRNQIGKTKSKFYVRSKVSKHGKEAREELSIDIAENRKFHHVEEQDKNDHWTTVHHEDESLKGKKKQRK